MGRGRGVAFRTNKKELAEGKRFAEMLSARGVETTHNEDYLHVESDLGRYIVWMDRNGYGRNPFSVNVLDQEDGQTGYISEIVRLASIYDTEIAYVQLVAKYRGRKKGSLVERDDTYQLPLPGGRARSNPAKRPPNTIYSIAATVIPKYELQNVPTKERKTADGIALAIERSGGADRQVTRTKILRAIGAEIKERFTTADDVVRWLPSLDKRLAQWAAITAARSVEDLDSSGKSKKALDDAEKLMSDPKHFYKAKESALEAFETYSSNLYAPLKAAKSAIEASNSVAFQPYRSPNAVYAVMEASDALASVGYNRADDRDILPNRYKKEIRRLVSVIADALPGLPPDPSVR